MISNKTIKNILNKKALLSLFLVLCLFIPTSKTFAMSAENYQASVELIQNLRTIIKNKVVAGDSGALQAQAEFEKMAVEYLAALNKDQDQTQNLNKIIDLIKNITPKNTADTIKQVQEIADSTPDQQDSKPSDISSQFQELMSKMGGIPGAEKATQGLQQIQQYIQSAKNPKELITGLMQKLMGGGGGGGGGGIAEAANKVNSLTSGAGVTQGAPIQGLEQAQEDFQGQFDEMDSAANDALGAADDADSGLDGIADEAQGLEDAQADPTQNPTDQQTDPNKQKEEEKLEPDEVCEKAEGPKEEGEEGDKGVPTIEQPGKLLSLTGRLVQITSDIKVLTQASCKNIKGILELQKKMWKKLDKDDPEQQKKSYDEFLKADEKFQKSVKEGRKPNNDIENGKKPFWVTAGEFMTEQIDVVVNYFAFLMDDSSIKEELKKVDENLPEEAKKKADEQVKLEQGGDKAKIKAALTPTFESAKFKKEASKETDLNKLTAGYVASTYAQNNPSFQPLLQASELAKLKDKQQQLALADPTNGNGWIGKPKCIEEFQAPGGKKMCKTFTYEVPPSDIMTAKNTFIDQKIVKTAQNNMAKQDEVVAVKKVPEEVIKQQDQGSDASTGGDGGGDGTDTSGNTGGSDIGSQIQDTVSQINSGGGGGDMGSLFQQLIQQLLQQQQQQSNPSDDPATPTVTPVVVIMPEKPAITISTEDLGSNKISISWKAEIPNKNTATVGGEMISCATGNDWYDFNTNKSGELIYSTGTDIESVDTIDITKPTIFAFKPYTSTNQGKQDQDFKKTYSTDSAKETITYSPDISGLSAGDYFFIDLDGKITSAIFEDSDTSKIIAQKLLSALDGNTKFAQYSKNINDSGNLVISKTISTTGPTSATYKITCKNAIDQITTAEKTIEFYKN